MSLTRFKVRREAPSIPNGPADLHNRDDDASHCGVVDCDDDWLPLQILALNWNSDCYPTQQTPKTGAIPSNWGTSRCVSTWNQPLATLTSITRRKPWTSSARNWTDELGPPTWTQRPTTCQSSRRIAGSAVRRTCRFFRPSKNPRLRKPVALASRRPELVVAQSAPSLREGSTPPFQGSLF
jgi:hypothetical protein